MAVDSAYQVFVDLDATALEGGFVYVGAAYDDPEQQPIATFWDAALTIPAAQPLRTSGGFIVRDGTPAEVFTAESIHSVRVRASDGRTVYYVASVGGALSAARVRFPIPGGPPGPPGTPGGNVMSVGDFSDLPTLLISLGTDRIVTRNGAAYIADAAVNPAYVAAHPRTAAITQNGRGFRLDPNQLLYLRYFGCVGDYVGNIENDPNATDDYEGLTAALNFRANPAYAASPFIYAEAKKYYTSKTLVWDGRCTLIGVDGGLSSLDRTGRQSTWIVSPKGVRTMYADVSRQNGFSLFTNIMFSQHRPSITDGAHAVDMSVALTMIRCSTFYAGGDGIHIEASTNGDGRRYGEASNWVLEDCSIFSAGYDGLSVAGADTNTGRCTGLHVFNGGPGVRLCAVKDLSYFTNSYENLHITGYGTGGVWENGRNWQCLVDNQSNRPSQNNTRNKMIWYDRGPAAAPSAAFPAWTIDTIYRAQGPGLWTNPASIKGVYCEGEGAYGFMHAPVSTVFGKDMGWTVFTPIVTPGIDGLLGSPQGMGFYRSTKGNADDPAYPAIGDYEAGSFGYRDGDRPRSARTGLMRAIWKRPNESNNDAFTWDWVRNNAALAWVNYARDAMGMLFASPNGLKGKRKSAYTDRFYQAGLLVQSRNDPSKMVAHDVGVGATTAPGEHEQSRFIWNDEPAPGGVLGWVCVTSGAISGGTWAAQNYGLGDARTSDGKIWVVTSGPSNTSTAAPTGASPYTDPTSGMTWESYTAGPTYIPIPIPAS